MLLLKDVLQSLYKNVVNSFLFLQIFTQRLLFPVMGLGGGGLDSLPNPGDGSGRKMPLGTH